MTKGRGGLGSIFVWASGEISLRVPNHDHLKPLRLYTIHKKINFIQFPPHQAMGAITLTIATATGKHISQDCTNKLWSWLKFVCDRLIKINLEFLWNILWSEFWLWSTNLPGTQTPSTHFPYLLQLKGAIDHGEQKQIECSYIHLLSFCTAQYFNLNCPGT